MVRLLSCFDFGVLFHCEKARCYGNALADRLIRPAGALECFDLSEPLVSDIDDCIS